MTNVVLDPITDEQKRKIWAEIGLDERRVKEGVQIIRKWLEMQPHLPNVDNDDQLERWLIRCKNSIERVKQTIDVYYTIRSIVPELMMGWCPDNEWFKIACKHTFTYAIPQLTPDLCRIIFVGFLTEDASDFDLLRHGKLCLMMQEILLREDYNLKSIIVFDMEKMNFGHSKQFTLAETKKLEVCYLRGYISRMKALHMVNPGKLTEFMFGLIKGILSKKLASRVYMHGSDMSDFGKQVPLDLLPVEYGGKNGSAAEHWDRWQKKMWNYQNWYHSREQFKSVEMKRPKGKVNIGEVFGFHGTFRKLDVD